MPKTISNGRLTPDATYLIRGQVGYSRISRQTTDQERETANKRRQHPIDKNYTSITLFNAQVLARDSNNLSIEEQYAIESLYRSSSENYPGNNFTGINKSKYLPRVAVIDPNTPNTYNEITPAGELATGLDVTVVMRVFKGQGGNNGVSLDRVLVNEPIRYYNGVSPVDKALSGLGITFNAIAPSAVEPTTNDPAQHVNEAVAQAAPVAPAAQAVAPVAPVASVAQAAPPVTPVNGNPFSAYAAPVNGNNNGNNDGGAASGVPTFGPGTRQY